MARRTGWIAGTVVSLAALSSLVGCGNAGEELQRVQRAVGTGAQAALTARAVELPAPSAVPTPAPRVVAPAVTAVPVPTVGSDGSLAFAPDANHAHITGARTADGVVVAWTDGARHAVYTGRLDGALHARGEGVRVHEATDEESIAAPAVAATPEGHAVAWADRDNGRIRFARIDAQGAVVGRVAIVHDGVDAPRSVALGYTGHEFAVAASLRDGVYFARLGADGERVGEGRVFAEGESVRSVDALTWDGRAFDLAVTVRREGGATQLHHRVTRGDRRSGPSIVSTLPRTAPNA